MGRRKRGRGVCHEWASSATCKFGDACRFSHDAADVAAEAANGGGGASGASGDGDGDAKALQDAFTVPLWRPDAPRGEILRPRSLEERSFTQWASTTADGPRVLLLEHPNGLWVVRVAPAHAALDAAARSVVGVEYLDVNGTPLASVEVKGKKKRGSVFVTADTALLRVTCSDGSQHAIQAGVAAHVIEVNARLQAEPALLGSSRGYVAILRPTKNVQRAALQVISAD